MTVLFHFDIMAMTVVKARAMVVALMNIPLFDIQCYLRINGQTNAQTQGFKGESQKRFLIKILIENKAHKANDASL